MGSKILFNTVFINLEQVVHSGSFFAVYRCAHKLLDTFLFMKILPEQDTRMNEYSSHLEISID